MNGSKVKDGRYDYFNYWYFAYDKFTYPLRIQPIYLGLFTNVGLVLLLYIKNCIKLKSYYFRLASLSVLILLVASRSQIFIFVLNYSLFLLIFDKSNLQKKVLTICSLVAVFAIISLINPVTRTRLIEAVTYNEAFYKDDFGGASIRIMKWNSALRRIKNSPVFGYGVGDGKNELLEQYKRDKFYLGFYNKYNAHNQYLDTVLCLGFIGLIILLLIIFYAYKYAVNSMSLFLITNIFTVGFLTESILYRQWGIMAFSFLLVMFSVFKLEKHED
ncbi:O-antigen ligase family protein [Formosa sp. 3Alg 14/1]|uniref:O-antigen ligase family protein n=1 Tax=Formosa sp. 3Alg 14/1 TaxID=3382190 RepID=UPI0039BE3055